MEKGALGLNHMYQMAKKFFPTLKGGAKSLDDLKIQQAESKMAWEGLNFTLGLKLIPMITKVMAWFTKLTISVREGRGVWGTLGAVLGWTAGAFGSVFKWITKTKVGTDTLVVVLTVLTALWAVNKIMAFVKAVQASAVATALFGDAGLFADAAFFPVIATIGAIVLGVGALGFAVYEVIKHWQAFEGVMVGIWHWISNHWKLLAAIITYPLTGPLVFIIGNWNKFVGFFGGVVHSIGRVGKGMWDWLKDEFKAVLDWIIGVWNKFTGVFQIPGIHLHVGPFSVGYGGSGRLIPSIPMLAEGGTVRKGGSVIVGDRGPELLSLPAGARVDPLLGQGRMGSTPPGTWRGGGRSDLVVSVQIDRKEIGRALLREVNSMDARFA